MCVHDEKGKKIQYRVGAYYAYLSYSSSSRRIGCFFFTYVIECSNNSTGYFNKLVGRMYWVYLKLQLNVVTREIPTWWYVSLKHAKQ